MKRLIRVAAVVVCCCAYWPPAEAGEAPALVLSQGVFSTPTSTNDNTMTCSGSPSRTCTHKWKASRCTQTIAGQPGVEGCSFATITTTLHRTRGTGVNVGGRWHCTTSSQPPELTVSVVVGMGRFGSTDVVVEVDQTNGAGTFHGSRSMLDKTVVVEGTFATPGDQKGGACGPYPAPGRVDGSFQVKVPA